MLLPKQVVLPKYVLNTDITIQKRSIIHDISLKSVYTVEIKIVE